MIYLHARGLYHVLLLICNRELLFIGKRKDEDDMAKSTKTYEERIRALEKKEQESIEATKKLIAQRKELEKRKKAEESKKRTHRLCQIGGAVESVLGVDTAGVGESSQVVVSGYILPGLQLKYGVGIFDSLATITLRYRLMPRLYLEAASGVNQAFDVLYSFEY